MAGRVGEVRRLPLLWELAIVHKETGRRDLAWPAELWETLPVGGAQGGATRGGGSLREGGDGRRQGDGGGVVRPAAGAVASGGGGASSRTAGGTRRWRPWCTACRWWLRRAGRTSR